MRSVRLVISAMHLILNVSDQAAATAFWRAVLAQPGVTSAVFEGSHLVVQLLFTPLIVGWLIWAGIASSCGRRT
jgi:catechol 2,3-dioxygenase-like lactoylglutathione lyase family enzyme